VRLILVPTADRPECAVALDAAFALAKTLPANVSGCHVRPARFETPSTMGQLMPDDIYDGFEESGAQSGLDSAAARALFVRVAERHGFELARRPAFGKRSLALWHEMVGTPARVFAIAGPVADLTVVSRPKAKSAGRAKAFVLAALLHSVKPVLVVPQKRLASVGKRIVIAWNQSAEAATAVSAAIPLLQRAESVVVVSSGPENRAGPKSSYLAQYLTHWDVKTERVRTPGHDVEKEIEQAYRSASGDLLLMGAYSRHRFRQLVFGGVTEHMLFKTEIPVLMLHR
jgi:nucleotide-binding universal stress UspA family protein